MDDLTLTLLVLGGEALRCPTCDGVYTPVAPRYRAPNGQHFWGWQRSNSGRQVARQDLPHAHYGPDPNRRWRSYMPCSRECRRAHEAQRGRRRRALDARFRSPDAPRVCQRPSCGTAFISTRRDARFCSTRCRVAVHRATRAGSTDG